MVIVSVSNLCSLLIRLYSTCTNLDKPIVTRCDNMDAKYIQIQIHLNAVQQLLCHLATFAMTTHRGGNYSLQTNVDIFGSTLFSPYGMCVMGKVYFFAMSGFMSKIFCCSMSLLPHFTTHLCQHVLIHYLLLASPASNLHDVCTTLP